MCLVILVMIVWVELTIHAHPAPRTELVIVAAFAHPVWSLHSHEARLAWRIKSRV